MFNIRIFSLFLYSFFTVLSIQLEDNFEDITIVKNFEHIGYPTMSSQFATTTSSVSEKEKKAMFNYFARKKAIQSEKIENYKMGKETSLSTGSSYGVAKAQASISRDPGQEKQVVAGIPDLGDPCFRRYANCIVVNAQPYERRSSTSLISCKSHCLHSQSGVYSCRSFVYDNINQVCDLFAHVGDQAPARLLKFQTRDYFEPTSTVQCLNFNNHHEQTEFVSWLSTTVALWTTTTLPLSTLPTDHPVALASKVERKDPRDKIEVRNKNSDVLVEQRADEQSSYGTQCSPGKRASFLRTEGFELFNNDDVTMAVKDVEECTTACERNRISGQNLNCKSFDFSSSVCSFTEEAAVPVGNGQLKQRKNSFYYEKICINEKITQACFPTFNRFPQMVLVGFAEGVTDSTTFENCFDNCLNSRELFGFNCSSGMYFFEETQLNCILNSEDRHSQKELFAEENNDIVDYFEVSCDKVERPRTEGVKSQNIMAIKTENLVIAEETQTEWSKCEDGIQHRRRDCREKKNCGLESRACSQSVKAEGTMVVKYNYPTEEDVAKLRVEIQNKGFDCPKDDCCPVFGCAVGLRFSSHTRQLEWCKRQCEEKGRRLV